MRKISRKLVTVAISTALALPGVSGITAAQSSFGSSSYDSSSTSNSGSKSVKLKRALEKAITDDGHILSPAAEKRAQALLKRALNHELPFVYNFYQSTEFNPLTRITVLRFTPAEVDQALENLGNGVPLDFGGLSNISVPFGLAIGKDSDFYYVAVAEILR